MVGRTMSTGALERSLNRVVSHFNICSYDWELFYYTYVIMDWFPTDYISQTICAFKDLQTRYIIVTTEEKGQIDA